MLLLRRSCNGHNDRPLRPVSALRSGQEEAHAAEGLLSLSACSLSVLLSWAARGHAHWHLAAAASWLHAACMHGAKLRRGRMQARAGSAPARSSEAAFPKKQLCKAQGANVSLWLGRV